MQFDKLTMKSQEVIQEAQRLAETSGHQEIQGEHLLHALLAQSDGVVVPVLQRLGVQPGLLLAETDKLLTKVPKVSGSGFNQVYLSLKLKNVLDHAFKLAGEMRDEYVSQEHLF
ncbi:MAG: type VI secretion system ATPase TssH, partial [Desulfobulbaceae bacterium]|nr:type VI secretion system ATPase TssH [Desulfobulbaceae bacterium]